MKIKKKTAVIATFLAGALLFTTTALADIADKSGYEQFKEAIKNTSASCTGSFDNYQVDFSYVLKDNGTELCYENVFRNMTELIIEQRMRISIEAAMAKHVAATIILIRT
jgi:hypothetical protein